MFEALNGAKHLPPFKSQAAAVGPGQTPGNQAAAFPRTTGQMTDKTVVDMLRDAQAKQAVSVVEACLGMQPLDGKPEGRATRRAAL